MSTFMLWPSADWTATRKCNRVKGCAQMRRPICSSTFYAALLSSRLGQNQGRKEKGKSCPSRFSSVHWGAGGPQFLWFTLRKVGFYNSLQKRTRERNKRTKGQKIPMLRASSFLDFKEPQFSVCLLGPNTFFQSAEWHFPATCDIFT